MKRTARAVAAHALALSLLCSGCIPPREGPDPRYEPWNSQLQENDDVRSGFDTFVWHTSQLKDGSRRYRNSGGYSGFSGKTPNRALRRSATYAFGLLGEPPQTADRITYEVEETNKCLADSSIDVVWGAIAKEGRLSEVDVADPTFGRIKRYERTVEVAQRNAIRTEAGLLLEYRDRIYALRAYEMRPNSSSAGAESSDINALKVRRERLLRSITFKSGQADMCRVIATEP